MRVFIAIEVPEDVKNYLEKMQQQLPKGKLRLVKSFHLTLKFLGEITPDKVERIKQLLGNVKFEKFAAETSSMGIFPSENYIRVIWIGLEPEELILQLQRQVENALADEFKKERGFKTHLTLARVKYVDDKKEFAQELKKIKTERVKFIVESFKLKKSTLTGEGPVYEDLAVFTP